MLIIGLVLFVAAAVFGLDLADQNRFRIRDIEVFGTSLGVNGSATLFVIGAIVGAVLMVGFVMMLAGLRRRSAKARVRRQERRAVDRQEGELAKLRTQNAELGDRLAQRADGPGGV